VLDALSTLVDVHLVEPVLHTTSDRRFTFLDTIHGVAAQLLTESGEQAELRHRHRQYFLGVVTAAGPGLESSQEGSWFQRIDLETAEIAAVLEELTSQGRTVDAVAGACALAPYWLNRGQWSSTPTWLTGLRDHDVARPELRAVARGWAARLALDARAGTLDAPGAQTLIDELAEVRAELAGETASPGWLRACEHYSYALRLHGDQVEARTVTAQALAACRADQSWWRAEHLLRLALLSEQDATTESTSLAREAVRVARLAGNGRVYARAQQVVATSDRSLTTTELEARLEEVLALSATFGDRRGWVTTAALLGMLAWVRRDRTAAAEKLDRALTVSREIGYQHGVGFAQLVILTIAAGAGQWQVVATLHGVLQRTVAVLARQMNPRLMHRYPTIIEQMRRLAGPALFDASVADGALLGWDEGTEAALDTVAEFRSEGLRVARSPDAAGTGSVGAGPLSAREHEVLTLVALGLTNQQIATRLHLSAKTVMHHCGHIYSKLDVRGRAEAVVWAARHGLLPD
jgi:non-specific serine/threonine protein kinase